MTEKANNPFLKIALWTLLVLVAVCVAACGGSSGTSNSESIDTTPDINLPPDPGDAGNATLEGIDSDEDGVRDDIQIAIAERYPDNQEMQVALKQGARALQSSISAGDASNVNLALKVAADSSLAIYCLYERFDDASEELSFLEVAVVNTSARSDAYINYNAMLSGRVFGGGNSPEDPCE